MRRDILFEDLEDSGRALAESLRHYRDDASVVVLGIVRGGVPVAEEVAAALHAPLELALRKSLFIRGIDDAAGVVSVAGHEVRDDGVVAVDAPTSPEEWFIAESLRAFRSRVAECRGDAGPMDLEGRTVIVVDNSIRTTLTARTTMRAVSALRPARTVLAVALCAGSVASEAALLADEFVTLAEPPVFAHAGMFYRTLNVPDESAIRHRFETFRQAL
jgi:predicted phosphoribosyltransferase